MLFLLYVNDLPSVSSKCNFILYADDTNLLYNSSDIFTLINDINNELDKLYSWCKSNKLNLNAKKTVAIIFHPHNKNVDVSNKHVTINNTSIPFSHSTNFLGILIDDHPAYQQNIR